MRVIGVPVLIQLLSRSNPEVKRQPPNHCDVCKLAGKSTATREGKHLCSEHVDQSPYVKALMQRILDKDGEIEKVEKQGKKAVEPNSFTLREMLAELSTKGARTVERLVRELNISQAAVEGYAAYLKKTGQIKTRYTKRGSKVIELIKQPEEIPTKCIEAQSPLGPEYDRLQKLLTISVPA